MFLHQLHAALGAIARRVFHDFRVHGAGVLMCVVAAAVFMLGLAAARQAERGHAEGERHQSREYPFRFHFCFVPFVFGFSAI